MQSISLSWGLDRFCNYFPASQQLATSCSASQLTARSPPAIVGKDLQLSKQDNTVRLVAQIKSSLIPLHILTQAPTDYPAFHF